MKTSRFCTTFFYLLAISFMLSPAEALTPEEEEAQQILADTEVKGGLIVHIGCGDGRLTAALRANDSYIVHGLDADPCNIKDARDHIRSQGLYGEVSVEQFDSNNLPYIENLVNLVVSEDLGGILMDEVLRVLAPKGVAYIWNGSSWDIMVKDWPADMDEWSHFLRASNNNAVSQDAKVGPPRHVQWIFEPKWTRGHHKLNSVSSIVTAKGRMFYIMDTGPAATFDVGAKWYLVAQDAFNGIMLWGKKIDNWTSITKGFRSGPVQLPRTLVTDGDYVYLPLGVSTSLTAIDAATGAEVRNYQDTNYVEEVIYNDGALYVATGSPSAEQSLSVYPNAKSISAIDANNGNLIWKYDSPADITPVTLAVEGQRVFFHSANNVVCLNKSNGNVNWTKAIAADNTRAKGWAVATLVISDDVVLLAVAGQLRALDVTDGTVLWNVSCSSGFKSASDVFVIDGEVWTGPKFDKSYDLHTGAVTGTNSIMNDLQTAGHHHRCYRERATINYIIGGHRGMEFMDLTGDNHYRHNWARGTCQYGMMPANGLCYIPPHSCGCYMEAKLFGFVALANTRTPWSLTTTDPNLEQGPAYGTVNIIDSYSDEWPTLRYNSKRSATTANVLPYDALGPQWQRDDVGAKLSAPTVADDKVLVADISGHRILAFDASNGDLLWSYTAGGRVDSPPTAYNGMVFFGSNDGYVYCLALNNGSLIWRFRAAPVKMYAMGQENVESLWPVHGSILIQNDTVYFAAGRSSYLDNGIYLYGLEPTTGAVKYSTLCKSAHGGVDTSLDDGFGTVTISQNTEDYKTRNHPDYSDSFSMAGGVIADVLSGDGTSVFMKSLRYDNMLVEQEDKEAHFFSTSSILDGEENHRSHAIYGTGDFSRMPVAYSWTVYKNNRNEWITVPFGLKLSFNEDKIWGVLRGPLYNSSNTNVLTTGYVLYSKDLGSYTAPDYQTKPSGSKYSFDWQKDIEMRARAMLCAGSYIYIGGMPNRVDADDPFAVIEGRRDGLLKIYNAGNGNEVFDMVLESPPVWDGMAAANGRLYLSLENGEVLCLSGNILPMVDAGEDQTIYPMATALLDANVTDDGFPFGTLTTDWTKFAGPGEVAFDDPCAVDTNASFSQWGRYTLRLTAFDGGASNYDDANVFVCRPGDLDCDNDVDGLDMEQFAAQWLSSGCDDFNDWCSGADQKAGGSVSFGSYAVVASNWLLGMEPAAPTNLVAVAGDSQVSLNWDDNTEADLAGYNVYRSTTSGSGYVQIASGVAVSDYVDNTVTNDTTYYYVVTAVDTGGYESDYSNEASATPHTGPGVTELDALPSGPEVVLVSVGSNQQNAAFERNPNANNPTHHDYKKSGMTIEDAVLDGDEVNMTSITLLFNLVKHNEATEVTIPDEAGHVMQFWFGQFDVSGVPQPGGVINTIDVRGVTFTAGKYYRFTLDAPVTFDASATNDWAWQGWWTTDDIDNDLVWARTNNNDVFAGGMLYERDESSTNTTFPFTDPTAAAGNDLIFAMEIGVE